MFTGKKREGKAFQAASSACAKAPRWELKGHCGWSAPGDMLMNEEGSRADHQGLIVLNSKSRGWWDGWPSLWSRPRNESSKVCVNENRPGSAHQAFSAVSGPLTVFVVHPMSREVSQWVARQAGLEGQDSTRHSNLFFWLETLRPDSLLIPMKIINQ